ncbi:MAG: MBL fold metallo-hydrolase [Flavisolibacter sp.]
MSLFITSLNSGSNGNCYYLGNETEAVLVDAGISCREIDKRMKRLGLSMQKIKAVFISHEHTDHTRGLYSIVKKYKLPVYITKDTLKYGGLRIDPGFIRSFSSYEPVKIGGLSILPFPKNHDAADPYSFTISCNEIKVGVFTDIGIPCEHVTNQFRQCHAAFLEANYDDEMLDTGNYPYYLKKRIRGGKGHLSNTQALEIFTSYRSSGLSHLLLSHLSKNNNSPQLVSDLFNRYAGETKIIVASRFEETPVYHIQSGRMPSATIYQYSVSSAQLELSFS